MMAAQAFDFVIVGGGTAGCVLSNRLSANGRYTVCLIEAGPPDRSLLLRIPAGVFRASSNPKYAWQFHTAPDTATANRSIPIPQGKALGGSTSINGMIWNRGRPEDFDSWLRSGNRGWGYADVLPYFKRSEHRIGVCDQRYRGTDGPLPITDSDWRHPICDAFIETMYSLGLPRNVDYNGAAQAGAGYYQRYIEGGLRVSAARGFLRPAANRKNLVIYTREQATALLFQGRRAIGVRCAPGPSQPTRDILARREVILCAGAANTPKLLQLSGVGPPAVCAQVGVPLVKELQGVGLNLCDHYMVYLTARVRGVKTINGRGIGLCHEAAKWMLSRPSILAISPSMAVAFVNSQDLCATPDLQLDFSVGNYTDEALERHPVIKAGFFQLRPQSRGFVRVCSPDPFEAPIIRPRYLVDEDDQRTAVRGIKMVRRVLATPPLQHYWDVELLPGLAVAADADCLQFAREAGQTAYHLCGTCRMGPSEDRASVVDDELRVHGLEALRIVDASIAPTIPSANISAAVFMIAEKASDMILGYAPSPVMDAEIALTPAAAQQVSAAGAPLATA